MGNKRQDKIVFPDDLTRAGSCTTVEEQCAQNGKTIKRGQTPTLQQVADRVADQLNADVLVYVGPIEREKARRLIEIVMPRRKRANVLLMLVTLGWDPHAAYMIARCLQSCYERFFFFVPGYCKSAGTLVALGAYEIIYLPFGELGPLDVQIPKRDELGAQESGWVTSVALDSLITKAFEAFEAFFLETYRRSGTRITTPTAARIATDLTIGLFEPLFGQINPGELGSVTMALQIAEQYGSRLNLVHGNLKPGGLDTLVARYPSHGFIIDIEEATALFERVRQADGMEITLGYAVSRLAGPSSDSTGKPIIDFLSSERVEANAGASDDTEPGDEEEPLAADPNPPTRHLSTAQETRKSAGNSRNRKRSRPSEAVPRRTNTTEE
jgi:hypothetical protein